MRFFLHFILVFLLIQPLHADTRFLTISDIHYGADNKPGDGHNTDELLLASAINKFSQLTNQADFIITLGDFPKHMLMYSSKKAGYIQTVFHDLFEADRHNKPMFYITGNNDSLQGNYQPFSSKGESPLTLAKDWQGACVHCDGLIIDGTHMLDEGYYSSYVLPGNKDILLIALNSVQFSKTPFFTPKYSHQDKDASEQLRWLDVQLKTHHAKQLLIAMHVPPGKTFKGQPFWHDQYLKQFITLLNQAHPQYEQISLLSSHTHMDDIRKIRLDNGKNIYDYATPSISRIHHNYPAMKMFDIDNDLKLKDYTTYYTTKDAPWENKQYQAINGIDSVFPQCHGKIITECMDALPENAVCKTLENGRFYGAKSPRVDSTVCKVTYPVN